MRYSLIVQRNLFRKENPIDKPFLKDWLTDRVFPYGVECGRFICFISAYRLLPVSYPLNPICALPADSPLDCRHLRHFARLMPRHGRLQIPHSTFFGDKQTRHPRGRLVCLWRRVWDLNPRYQNGTQHFQCCSFGRSDNSTRPNESLCIQLLTHYIQSTAKNQAFFKKILPAQAAR